jgi:hypothetical protein
MDERAARLHAHQRNIDRYQSLLKTNLSAIELRFVEQRLSEERFTLAMLRFMDGRKLASDILANPDAVH